MQRILFSELQEWKKKPKRKPLILGGARQVGKTYLLKEFGRQCFSKTHYLNFEKAKKAPALFEEDLDPKVLFQKLNFFFQTSIDIHHDLVIFDEIQECPRALTSLKYFAEEMPQLALCTAGSLLGVHLGPVSFPVGKVDMLHLYPMTFIEFLIALNEEQSLEYLKSVPLTKALPEIVHSHLWDRLKWYFITGGLPEVVDIFRSLKENLFEAFQAVRRLQRELIIAYHADMAKHSGKVNAMHLERVWKSIPEQLSKSHDASAQKFIFKDILPGTNRYSRLAGVIDWLEAAGLIIKVNIVNTGHLPFSAYIMENHFKLFLFDIGILGTLSEIEPNMILEYNYGSYKGFFAENFVAQEFLASGQPRLYSWQEKTAEVEFLRQIDGHVIPIEVNSGWVTHAKSLSIFATKYHPPYRIIFSVNPLSIDNKSRIHRYPLYLAGQFPINPIANVPPQDRNPQDRQDRGSYPE